MTIGKVVYHGFPTYDDLYQLRPDVREETLRFLTMLGLRTWGQISVAIGDSEDEVRIHGMLTQAGIPKEIPEDESEKNRQVIQELQTEVLKDKYKTFFVPVKDVYTKLYKIHYVRNALKALKDVLMDVQEGRTDEKPKKTVRTFTFALDERTDEDMARRPKATQTKVIKPRVIASRTPVKPVLIITTDFEDKVNEMVAKCPISAEHDFKKARNDIAYLKELTGYFPDASVNMLMAYLFREEKSMQLVQKALRDAGVSKGKGYHAPNNTESFIQRAAFVYWAGGSWKDYLRQICTIQNEAPDVSTAAALEEEPAAEEAAAPEEAPAEEASVAEESAPEEKDVPTDEPAAEEEDVPADEPADEADSSPEDIPDEAEPELLPESRNAGGAEPTEPNPKIIEPKKPEQPAAEAEISIRGTKKAILKLLAEIEERPDIELVETYIK